MNVNAILVRVTQGEPGQVSENLTFVFTDVVGSTKLWAADPEATASSFAIHDSLVRSTLREHGGNVFGWAGDSFRAAFENPRRALAACLQIHEHLKLARWDTGPELTVRIGVNRGRALQRDGEFFGPVLNTAARLESLAWPGQTVLTAHSVADAEDIDVRAIGVHLVPDLPQPIELLQLGQQLFPPPRTVDFALSSLPPIGEPILGRAGALAQVRAALGPSKPTTVVGVGGAGKTRLAIEVAHHELASMADGCFFVDLTAAGNLEGVTTATLRAMRVQPTGAEMVGGLSEVLDSKQVLLILDNCEHVIEATRDFVATMRARATSVTVLATSREPVGFAGEQVIALKPLPVTQLEDPSVELFVSRTRRAAPGFEASGSDLEKILEVCYKLDGLPLAIELAAARAAVLGLDFVSDRMDDKLRLLREDLGPNGRALEDTIEWSHDLLSSDEQALFARCGVFSGPFDLAAAAAVFPERDPLDVATTLHSLVRKSLVVAEGPIGGRFRLLETIRAYALERLNEIDPSVPTEQLHFSHFKAIAQAQSFPEASDLDRAQRLLPDWLNIEAAMNWGAAHQHWDDLAVMVSGCVGLWEDDIPFSIGKQWMELVLPHVNSKSQSAQFLLMGLSIAEAQFDNFRRVFEIFEHLRYGDTPEVTARALGLFGYLHARSDPDIGTELLLEAHRIVDQNSLGPDTMHVVSWAQGMLALYRPDLEAAYEFLSKSFAQVRDSHHRTSISLYAGLSLATVQIVSGRALDAIVTLESFDASNSRWDTSPLLLGIASVKIGKVNEGADLIVSFAHKAIRGPLPRLANDALVGLALLAQQRGEDAHAWTLLQQAVTPRSPHMIGYAEHLAGSLHLGEDCEVSLRRQHRGRTVQLSELDASRAAQTELDRLGAEVAASRR